MVTLLAWACTQKGLYTVHLVLSGVMAVLLGYVATGIVRVAWPKVDLPEVCRGWNKYHTMEVSLFLVGVMLFWLFHRAGHITFKDHPWCKEKK